MKKVKRWRLSLTNIFVFLTFLCGEGGVDASGLSLTKCDDVCGIGKEPNFGGDGNSKNVQSNIYKKINLILSFKIALIK